MLNEKDQALIDQICVWASEKKAENITVLDLSDREAFTDCFIIMEGVGELHTRAIANHIMDEAASYGYKPRCKEGLDTGRWVLLDYSSCIVHIFQPETRRFYRLEELWGKTPEAGKQND